MSRQRRTSSTSAARAVACLDAFVIDGTPPTAGSFSSLASFGSAPVAIDARDQDSEPRQRAQRRESRIYLEVTDPRRPLGQPTLERVECRGRIPERQVNGGYVI